MHQNVSYSVLIALIGQSGEHHQAFKVWLQSQYDDDKHAKKHLTALPTMQHQDSIITYQTIHVKLMIIKTINK